MKKIEQTNKTNRPDTREIQSDSEFLDKIQRIARNSAIEPFEGKKSFETLQKTLTGLDKSISKIKEMGKKGSGMVTDTKLFKRSKERLGRMKTSSGLLDKLDKSTDEYQKIARQTLQAVEEKVKQLTLNYVEKGLETLLMEDSEEWILKRSAKVLNNKHLTSMDDVRNLSEEERDNLINSLYPYNNLRLTKIAKSFDTTVNISMGAIVATNIPGTGLLISLINMGKTIVKLGNRINIMSAIYGRELAGIQPLFEVSSKILKSLIDWETNRDHEPLNPEILSPLYSLESSTTSGFSDLIDTIIRKEAYIAIPGVGMISLGKINLDDHKMDLVVKNLIRDYFAKIEIVQAIGQERFESVFNDFNKIYREFLKANYFKIIRELEEEELTATIDKKWKKQIKVLSGSDQILETSSALLDGYARQIYLDARQLKKPLQESDIKKRVDDIISTHTEK